MLHDPVEKHDLPEKGREDVDNRKEIEKRRENGDTPYNVAVFAKVPVILFVAVETACTQKIGLSVEPCPQEKLHEDIGHGDKENRKRDDGKNDKENAVTKHADMVGFAYFAFFRIHIWIVEFLDRLQKRTSEVGYDQKECQDKGIVKDIKRKKPGDEIGNGLKRQLCHEYLHLFVVEEPLQQNEESPGGRKQQKGRKCIDIVSLFFESPQKRRAEQRRNRRERNENRDQPDKKDDEKRAIRFDDREGNPAYDL